MNIFNGSMAGISWFTYGCVTFSYGKSLQTVGTPWFRRITFKEQQRHLALVFGRMQQSRQLPAISHTIAQKGYE